jgi:hypothetical protein
MEEEKLEFRALGNVPEWAKGLLIQRGGPGSGHFGHSGRPGMQGGSLPGDFHSAEESGSASRIVHIDQATADKMVAGMTSDPNFHLIPSLWKRGNKISLWVAPDGRIVAGQHSHGDMARLAIDAVGTDVLDPQVRVRYKDASEKGRYHVWIGAMLSTGFIRMRVPRRDMYVQFAEGHRLSPSQKRIVEDWIEANPAGSYAGPGDVGGVLTVDAFDLERMDSGEMSASSDVSYSKPASLLGIVARGGPGSGHFGHEGRPGEVGGSLPGDFHSGKTRQAMRLRKHDRTKLQKVVERWGYTKPSLFTTAEHISDYPIVTLFAKNPATGESVAVAVVTGPPSGLAQLEADLTTSGENALAEILPNADDFHEAESDNGNGSLKRRIARGLELHNSPQEFLDTIEGAAWMDADGRIHKTRSHSDFLVYLESEYDLPDLPMYEDRYRRAMTDMGLIRMYRDETGVGAVFYKAANVTREQIDTLTVLAGGLRARGEGLGLFSDLPGLGPEAQAARAAEAHGVERKIGESEEIVVERAAPPSDSDRPPRKEPKKTSDWRTGKRLPDVEVDRASMYLTLDLPPEFVVPDVQTPTDWKPEISNPLDGDKASLTRWLAYNIRAYHEPEAWDLRDLGERAGVINRIPTPAMRERIDWLDAVGGELERTTLGPQVVALSEAVTAAFGGEPIPRPTLVQGDPDATIEVLAKGKTISGVLGQMSLNDWTALGDAEKRALLGEYYMVDAGLETGGLSSMLTDVVRVMYFDMQDILGRHGFERDSTLRLYRGLVERPSDLLPAEMDGGWVNVEISNLSPWTFSPGVAAEYATRQSGRGSLLAMDVPASMVFCNWETGPASRRWLSYLLMASRDPMKAYLYPVQRARLRNG